MSPFQTVYERAKQLAVTSHAGQIIPPDLDAPSIVQHHRHRFLTGAAVLVQPYSGLSKIDLHECRLISPLPPLVVIEGGYGQP